MRGFLLIERKAERWGSILKSRQLRMLGVSASVGIIAGIFVGAVRLKLGLPGHKVFLWLTPVIVARLLGRCKAGTTAGALSSALAGLALGGNFAGGILGLPLIGFAGVILDLVINSLEGPREAGSQQRQSPYLSTIPIIGITSMFVGLLCFIKRLLVPAGVNRHFLFGISGFWYQFICYAFFGLSAGLVAATIACLINRRHRIRRGIK